MDKNEIIKPTFNKEFQRLLNGELITMYHEDEVIELCQRLRLNLFDMELVNLDLKACTIQIIL
jgi:hypothetical protein